MGSSKSKNVPRKSETYIDPQIRPSIQTETILSNSGQHDSFDDDTGFEPTYESATPRFSQKIKYLPPNSRTDNSPFVSPSRDSTVNQLNTEDFIARIAVVFHNHIKRGTLAKEYRKRRGFHHNYSVESFDGIDLIQRDRSYSKVSQASYVSHASGLFDQKNFLSPRIKYHWIRAPRAVQFMPYVAEEVPQVESEMPDVKIIHEFILKLFKGADLSSECSLVSLVYVERLMELSDVRLDIDNWRPIVLSSLLTASKVWQDYASWNIEFSQVYPDFPLKSINKLETMFINGLKWKTVIDQGLYTKYYFALRGKTDNRNFRQRYNILLNVAAPNARRLEKRSKNIQQLLLSKSL